MLDRSIKLINNLFKTVKDGGTILFEVSGGIEKIRITQRL